jgi:hypothetical protein
MEIERLMKMKLHEWLETGHFDVLRVPGGWAYHLKDKMHSNGGPDQWVSAAVFVPEVKE